MNVHEPLYRRPEEILRHLLRFDTTNPPGSEAACIAWIEALLNEEGIETTLYTLVPGRPNLIARLKGMGKAPTVLLQGHVDVVPTSGQNWSVDPFAAIEKDGFLWGRGTLDMKGGVSMMLSAFLRLHKEGPAPPGDVLLCILSDEEVGGDAGAHFLVKQHPELFEGVKYGIGEWGGAALTLGGHRFYPIQVTEKQVCWMKATLRGPGGHASMPVQGGAIGRLADMLQAIDRNPLPVHVTKTAEAMIDALFAPLPEPLHSLGAKLLDPAQTNGALAQLGPLARMINPMLRNTVSPTIITASDKTNIIPSVVTVELDGRLLPGFTPEDMFSELRAIIGPEPEIELLRHDPGPPEGALDLFDMLAGVLKEMDPEGTPIPNMMVGVSDARFFALLGIQNYGFLPMKLPESPYLMDTVHAADERIPIEAPLFGAEAIYKALLRL